MSFWSGALSPSFGLMSSLMPQKGPITGSPREFYEVLEDYYQNNALYESLYARAIATQLLDPAILGLRNPANRVVEFYAKKVWPGNLPQALTINTANAKIIDPIHNLWTWSNWSALKNVWARQCALFGDGFLKVSTVNGPITNTERQQGPAKRIFLQLIDPKLVTDFTADERQFLTMIRLDEQLDNPQNPQVVGMVQYRTEVWDKEAVTVWTHEEGANAKVEDLGSPDPGFPIPLTEWGIDFVPFVHAKFRDIGYPRGVSSFQHALDKIDDLNRAVTRLHQLLYRHNDNTWVLEASGMDAARRPMPQLTFGKQANKALPEYQIAGSRMISLPGNYTLRSQVPQLDYMAAIEIAREARNELEDDLPEMAYYRTRDFGTNLSGVALTLILGPAVANVEETRGNMEGALIRAQQMALTIGQNLKIPGYESLGDYENGDFDHQFSERPVIQITQIEQLAAAAQKLALGVPKEQILLEIGYEQEQIDQWMKEDAAKQAAQAVVVAAANGTQPVDPRGTAVGSPMIQDQLRRQIQPGRTNPVTQEASGRNTRSRNGR